jgi:hypothetical protein
MAQKRLRAEWVGGAQQTLVPLTLQDARQFVGAHHRHSLPPRGHLFSIGLACDGQLIGCVIASRPVARALDDGRTIELTRLTTLGQRNACSQLYGAACRAGAALGYERCITYTLESESGASLRAAGFAIDGTATRAQRANPWRQKMQLWPDAAPAVAKLRWQRILKP